MVIDFVWVVGWIFYNGIKELRFRIECEYNNIYVKFCLKYLLKFLMILCILIMWYVWIGIEFFYKYMYIVLGKVLIFYYWVLMKICFVVYDCVELFEYLFSDNLICFIG